MRIFKTYGHEAIQVMTENPYRLARDIRGIGFRTADAIAMKLGMAKNAPQRLRAGVSFALQESADDGNCGVPRADLLKLAGELLDVDAGAIEDALALEFQGGEVVADTIAGKDCIFLRGLYTAERGVAEPSAGAGRWRAALARDRRGKGHRMGRGKDRQDAGAFAARRRWEGSGGKGRGDHRRPGRWQDDAA
ncbi:ATP-dependent exoDNAse (exonuclease V) alpha subunit [Rhodoblastus acidophilus]|nr:ATP-dependent exoDNAse (exonuclease V) alpha subunit [Rhodoblastus acidophilus]